MPTLAQFVRGVLEFVNEFGQCLACFVRGGTYVTHVFEHHQLAVERAIGSTDIGTSLLGNLLDGFPLAILYQATVCNPFISLHIRKIQLFLDKPCNALCAGAAYKSCGFSQCGLPLSGWQMTNHVYDFLQSSACQFPTRTYRAHYRVSQ
ncbi:hypothetical protein D3C81_1784860 [compost metagenome]